ncbi:hypothetical protein AC812_11995 [Bellilinea caldifistulae]|uniref:Uncharacterized protein n=1 Tax=Bellilinea caldifistulae TaxID=360411 RepID=A0A0P6XZD9_9CHLR|nr:hypothetical protein AC812_11995 [Bellilinea caldifistulae]
MKTLVSACSPPAGSASLVSVGCGSLGAGVGSTTGGEVGTAVGGSNSAVGSGSGVAAGAQAEIINKIKTNQTVTCFCMVILLRLGQGFVRNGLIR